MILAKLPKKTQAELGAKPPAKTTKAKTPSAKRPVKTTKAKPRQAVKRRK